MHVCCCSLFQLFVTPWTVNHQASLPTGFSRKEYWSGLSCPPPGDLPDLGIKPLSLVFMFPKLADGSILPESPGKLPATNILKRKCTPGLFGLSSVKTHQDLARAEKFKQ